MKTCKYLLPCGKCDKYDEHCNLNREDLINYNILISEISPEYADEIKSISKCEHEWRYKGKSDISHKECEHSLEAVNYFVTDNYIGVNYKCLKCGTIKTKRIDKVSECNHDWQYTGTIIEYIGTTTDSHTTEFYKCSKCGEVKKIEAI